MLPIEFDSQPFSKVSMSQRSRVYGGMSSEVFRIPYDTNVCSHRRSLAASKRGLVFLRTLDFLALFMYANP